MLQRARVIQVDRHGLAHAAIEGRQEDVDRPRGVRTQTLLEGAEHHGQRVLRRPDRIVHTAGGVDHERDVVVLALNHVQATDVGNDDVVGIGAEDGVILGRADHRVVRRRVNRYRNLRGACRRTTQAFSGGRGHGQGELAVVVRRRGQCQIGQVPAGHQR
ncbi:hypothetical protein D3C80_1381570 [compost metagenome]